MIREKYQKHLKNNGKMDVEEVVQIYVSIKDTEESVPIASLIDFKRVFVKSEDQTNLTFSIPYEKFAYYNGQGEKVQHHGKAIITVSNASPGERSKALGAESFTIDVDVE